MAFIIEEPMESQAAPYSASSHVNLQNMAPEFISPFDSMSQEYYQATGKQLKIDDAWRSRDTQARAYADWKAGKKKAPSMAPPGKSNHEIGMAMDINADQANELASLGLLDKYGFL